MGHTYRGISKRPKRWPFEWRCTRGLLKRCGGISKSHRVDRKGTNKSELSTLLRLNHNLRGLARCMLSRVRDSKREARVARASKGRDRNERLPSKNRAASPVEETTLSASVQSGRKFKRSVECRRRSRETPNLVSLAHTCAAPG